MGSDSTFVAILSLLVVLQSFDPINCQMWWRGRQQRANKNRVRDDEAPKPPMIPSLLPLPNGPFYGFPFNGRQLLTRNLPLTVAGYCQEGTIYNISNVQDLYNYKDELECVYNAAYTPTEIPNGTLHGKLMTIFNAGLFNNPANALWQGSMITPVDCGDGKVTHLGWNNVLGRPAVPFLAEIRPLGLNLAPGEIDDQKESLILDYTQDFRGLCPEYRSFLQRNYQALTVRRSPLNNNLFPFNQLVDSLRLIGVLDDGSSLFIAKTFLRDAYRSDLQAATVAFMYVQHFPESGNETAATPVRKTGGSLPPLKQSFKYMFPGIIDLPFRLLPIENILTNPFRTIQTMIRGVIKTGRSAVQLGSENLRNVGKFAGNRKRFREAFEAGRQKQRQQQG